MMSEEGRRAMTAFLKSGLFLRFAGGFALGVAGMVAFAPTQQPALTTSAYAAPEVAAAPQIIDRAAR